MNLDELEVKKKKKPNENNEEASTASEIADETLRESGVGDHNIKQKNRVRIGVMLSLVVGIVLGGLVSMLVFEPVKVSPFDIFWYGEYFTPDGVSFESLDHYDSDEERFHSLAVTGLAVPNMNLKDGDGNEVTLYELIGDDERYILNFIKSYCPYCEDMVSVVSEYEAGENAYKVITICIDAGSLEKYSGDAYRLLESGVQTNNFVNRLNWVPAFCFVENNTVNLVKYGDFSLEELKDLEAHAFAEQ